nr:hypothetical protein [Elusimicrobiota bacterium]
VLVSVSNIVFITPLLRADNVYEKINSIEKDKYIHFAAGVSISHGSYPVFRKFLRNKENAWIYSFSSVVLISTAKELYDMRDTYFDWEDLLAGTLGGVTIIIVKF